VIPSAHGVASKFAVDIKYRRTISSASGQVSACWSYRRDNVVVTIFSE
jgi:hypothetical protein